MSKRKATSLYRPGAALNVRVTAKDITAAKREGLSNAQMLERVIARTYGGSVPRRVVRAYLKFNGWLPSMAERVERVMAKCQKAGMLQKCGRHWHFGGSTMEAFDIETVIEGRPPVWLPKGPGPTDRLTLMDVRRLVKATLEEKDREGSRDQRPIKSRKGR